MTIKKKPVRKCVACRKQGEKTEFIRIVKLKTGAIILDSTGKQNGRGAYICKSIECFERTKKESALNRAFKCLIADETYDEILAGLVNFATD